MNASPTTCDADYRIADRELGFTYDRIFTPYLAEVHEIEIEEPYIRKPYQFENLRRFCEMVVRFGQARSVVLCTAVDFGECVHEINARLETLKRSLADWGVTFSYHRSPTLHSRQIRLGSRWKVLIDRGLDIYYPPQLWGGIGQDDFALRPCRETQVTVVDMAA